MGVSIGENLTALVSACILTVSSSISIGEASPANVNLCPSVSDSVSVSENVGYNHDINPYVSDSIPISEDITSNVEFNPTSTSESIPISENTELLVGDLCGETSSSVSVSDSPAAVGGDPGVSASDSVAVGDNVNSNHALCPGVSESITATDAPVVDTGVVGPVSVSESLAVGEYEKTEVDLCIYVYDGVVVGITSIDLSESVAVGENIDIKFGYYEANVSDSVPITESTEGLTSAPVASVSDSVAVTEDIDAQGGTNPSVSDSVGVADEVPIVAIEGNASASESVAVGEDCSAVFGDFSWFVEDEISVTENTDVDIPELPANGGAEAVSVADSASIWIDITVDKSESIPVSESQEIVVSSLEPSVSESIPISELIDAYFKLSVSVSDGVSIAESVEGNWELHGSASESISVNDEAISGVLSISVSQDVTVSESVSILLQEKKQEIDLTLYLDTAKSYNFSLNTAENINLHIKRAYTKEFIR